MEAAASEVWPTRRPDTLEDCCIAFFLENIKLYLDKTDDSYTLKPGITFPHGLSDKILSRLALHTKHLQNADDNVFGIFNNRARTYLTSLPLRFTAVKPQQLEYLCTHPIREIDITYCSSLKADYVNAINQTSKTLQILKLGGSDQLERLDLLLFGNGYLPASLVLPDSGRGDAERSHKQETVFNLPKLQSFSLRDVKALPSADGEHLENVTLLDRMIRPLKGLTHLCLCNCQLERSFVEGLGDLELPKLVSLSLCDVLGGNVKALSNLCKLDRLRHLDVSEADDTNKSYPIMYPEPSENLGRLLDSLPHLTSLDISGTNLAGFLPVQPVSHKLEANGQTDDEPSGIPGTKGRHFCFLGLFNCADEAAHRKNLPADKVAGDANEEQILTALHTYTDTPSLLTRTLDALFNLFRHETVQRHYSALQGCLMGMLRNKHDRHVQIAGSATLFHIVNGQHKYKLTQSLKRQILLSLLDAMERHSLEYTMIRNGCLTFSIFALPQEVLFCYDRLVKVILQLLQSYNHDEFLMRIGIDLLNCLACQVESDRKKALGALGTVEVMCSIITRKLESQICDVTLQNCWSTLWNITDETDENCDKFMKQRGMYLFLGCFRQFPQKDELLRNMMGLMGNIAEVPELRPDLMNEEYITVFADFLESEKDGIEVSYNAAGVFAHILSDGAARWNITTPSRDNVIERMETAIRRWPLNSARTINYRSFGPIFRLVKCYESNTSQYWATWALCNLTQVYPDKYCPLLKEEGGLVLLNELIKDPRPKPEVIRLAEQVLAFIEKRDREQEEAEMSHLENGSLLL